MNVFLNFHSTLVYRLGSTCVSSAVQSGLCMAAWPHNRLREAVYSNGKRVVKTNFDASKSYAC